MVGKLRQIGAEYGILGGFSFTIKVFIRLPRQEVTVGRKFFVLRGVKGAFGNFYNRFTTFERCSDMMKIK